MKISSLDLIAFGPFTEKTLEFGEKPGGMTVIVGPNEAGKSSILRAIRGALYGIPVHTNDNFLHNNQKLRIGVELLDDEGNVTRFLRRKGSKGTLLSIDGDVLDESVIVDIFHGISESLFTSLFGITHQDLTEGGEDILNQQGELGQALFSASSARKNLHLTLKKLDEKANALFTPRGQKQAINAGLKKYAKQKSQLVESSLSSSDWAMVQEAFDKATEKSIELSAEIKSNDRELIELQRYERLLPKVAVRLRLQTQISEFAGVKQLDASFATRRQAAAAKLIEARSAQQGLHTQHEDLTQQVENGRVDKQLLSLETTIQSLHQSLESYIRAGKQLPILTQKYQAIESDLATVLRTIQPDLTPENMDQLLAVLGREADIKSFAAQYQSLRLERKQFAQATISTEQKIGALKLQEVEPADEVRLLTLRQEYQQAQVHSGLESDLRGAQNNIANMESEISNAIAALPYWDGTLEELQTLPVPGRQTMQAFGKKFSESQNEHSKLQAETMRLNAELQFLQEKIDGLKDGGDVPSKLELEEVRNSRNNAWSLLKEQWLQGRDVTLEAGFLDSQRKLPEAFEWRLGRADDIADRLRSDSDRVAQWEGYRADVKRFEHQKHAASTRLEAAESLHKTLTNQWVDEWLPCDLSPRSPEEMLEWRAAREDIQRMANDLSAVKSKASHLKATKSDVRRRLLLEPFDQSVDGASSINDILAAMGRWVEAAQTASQLHLQYRQAIERLEEDYSTAKSSLALTDKALEEWRVSWHKLIVGSGLAPDSVPDSATDRLQHIREAFLKRQELRDLNTSIGGQKQEIDSFTALHAELDVDPGILSLQQHVLEIYKQLNTQKQAQAVHRQNCETLAKLKGELEKANQQHATSSSLMSSLLIEAACESEALLPDLERRSAELTNLRAQLASLESDILQDGGGKTLEDIELAVSALDAASLSADINQIRQRINSELEPLKQQLSEERGSRRRELESMDGSGEVAVIAEETEETLAKLRKAVVQFMQLKTAAKLLRDEIERFRQQNQGPLLEIAGRYFSELTLGAYVGLGSDFSEQDKVILVAERSTGEKVLVDGMSNGTRDQLYLALRLAAFERSIEQRGPMPFIVDDILIEFDDERSRAALEIFSRLAKKTQVILFSHHPRIRELSKTLLDAPAIVTL